MLQNKAFSKILVWLPFLLLSMYCIDIYFTVPNADDYDFFLWIKRYGFWGFQEHMYRYQNGRFVASFFIACYSAIFNAIHIYWIFPLCFFMLLYYAFFVLIKCFFKYLSISLNAVQNAAYAAWLSLLFILVCKELSSFLFWMPGVINYQLVVLFCVTGTAALLHYQLTKSRRILCISLSCFALASGAHELFFLLTLPGLLFYLSLNVKRPAARNTAMLIMLTVLIPFLFSYFSGGTSVRQAQAGPVDAGVLSIAGNAFLRVAFLFGHLFTVPYLYIFLTVSYGAVNFMNSARLRSLFSRAKLSYLLLLLALQPMFIYTITVKNLSSGLPPRAENLLLIQATAVLVIIAIKLGAESKIQPAFGSSFLTAASFALLFFLAVSSQNAIAGFKGIISGYIYKEISEARLKNIKSDNGTKSLHLTNYQAELDSFYLKKYNKPMPLKLFRIAGQNSIILFSDVYDLQEGQTNSFRHYNDIDTLKTPFRISFSDTLIYLPVPKDGAH